MDLATIERRAPMWYKSCTFDRRDTIRAISLEGPVGRGKTTTIMGVPKHVKERFNQNIGMIVLNGAILNPPDSVGYLVPREVEGHMESIFTDPFFFRTLEGKRLEEYDGGIILIDEYDKCDIEVKKILGEAALSRRLGPHLLPKGWVVWFAGNNQGDRSGSTKKLDHLINRIMIIQISDSIDALKKYMQENGAHPITQHFANEHPQIMFMAPPEKQGPWCTPRSMMMADGYLQSISEDGVNFPDGADTIEEVGGMIGDAAASSYFVSIRLQKEMPDYEDILKNPMTVKVPTRPDAQMLVCFNLAYRVKADHMDPVIKYIERLDKEFAVTFVTSAIRRDFKLAISPAFDKWCKANASLLSALQNHSRR